ncbi:MAG: UMP kinase [Candidatus Vogelbacteria bacterium CG10_big_fil_rev_8_21_14_0_10_45_14]|uniref:Uridylate kinase n=1 Tax=Candidatus Vogelbacteria bacterium CG10_big_fil_rev_8_21_14_0_10_45_14 TaxID=1975042 RepID=A0A2H0RMU3_9BACT|nr:MAG: UMP kinase [Candidatus Vogelbacteria bacterium CG10_big_fil_rev_8_21_14_0_10_45_14]
MKRVVLKLSGESFHDKAVGEPFFAPSFKKAAEEIKRAKEVGVEMIIITGGGNIARGATLETVGMKRVEADQVGMLATIQNSLLLQSALESMDISTRVLSAVRVESVCEPFLRRRAIRHLEKGRVIICAGGTGNPFATTDSAAMLRALELDADALLFAKNGVEGVYSADPKYDKEAVLIKELTYREVIDRDLKFMDQAALLTGIESGNPIPIYVFESNKIGNLERVVKGENIGTVVKP